MLSLCSEMLHNQEKENKNIKEEKSVLENLGLSSICTSLFELRFQQKEHRLWGQYDLGSCHSSTTY